MKKRIVIVVVVVVSITALSTVAWLIKVGITDAIETATTKDAVLMVSSRLALLYRKNPAPTAAEIEDAILDLSLAGVRGVLRDRRGRPVDLYDTSFRVSHTLGGNRHEITVTSAGPDRLFGTPDDLTRVVGWDAPEPAKP
jgi:hypothetical protein